MKADPIPVVCARWCPTLPHPGGCSTIGAVRLSFRVRDGAGRFPVAVTTETAVGSAVPSCVLLIRLCVAAPLPPPIQAWVWLGGGLGVDRIVDASHWTALFPMFPCVPFLPPCGGRVGGVGGVLFVSAD